MRGMRRIANKTSYVQAREILSRAPYGVLSTTCGDGLPYGVPLCFVLSGNSIYFHCAVEGQKLDNLAHDSRVCLDRRYSGGELPGPVSPCDTGHARPSARQRIVYVKMNGSRPCACSLKNTRPNREMREPPPTLRRISRTPSSCAWRSNTYPGRTTIPKLNAPDSRRTAGDGILVFHPRLFFCCIKKIVKDPAADFRFLSRRIFLFPRILEHRETEESVCVYLATSSGCCSAA